MNKETFELRKKFLENAKIDLQNPNMDKIIALIKKAVREDNKKLLSYKSICSIGAENTGAKVNKAQYEKLLENIYKYWWDNAVIPQYESLSTKDKKYYGEKLVKNEDYIPTSKNRIESIHELLGEFEDTLTMGLLGPTYFQGKHFCVFYTNTLSLERKKFSRDIDLRVYLHIKIKNAVKLAHKLIKAALLTNTPLTLKMGLSDSRNDNFILYTNYKELDSTIALIEQVRGKYPELFVGCKVNNPMMAKYKGYMGLGEEPYSWGSYNSVRVDSLQKCYKLLNKEYKKDKTILTNEKIYETLKEVCKENKIDIEHFSLNDLTWWLEKENE